MVLLNHISCPLYAYMYTKSSTTIPFLQIGQNLPEFLTKVKQTQPFVLLLGDRTRPEQQFVILERKAIPANSIIHAFDLCFKIFYIFDIDYPWESSNAWDFIQKTVFGLGEGKGRCNSTSSVLALKNYVTSKEG